MILLLSMILGPGTVAGSSASIVLSGGTLGGQPDVLPPGSFDLSYEEAWVAQGSYSGIRVSFNIQGQGADHHELTLFIPCHSDFSVGYDSSRGEFLSRIPTTPFTFYAEQSAGVKDRFGRPRPMKVEFTHWKQSGKKSWSPRSVEFTACEIEVETKALNDLIVKIFILIRTSDLNDIVLPSRKVEVYRIYKLSTEVHCRFAHVFGNA